MKVLLDTHIWVWWLLASLPERERIALNRIASSGGIHLPAICLWEAQMLHAKGRIQVAAPFPAWLRQATSPAVLTVLPLDTDIVLGLDALPQNFHGDPADRMIVATARLHNLPLATHDKNIRKSRLVKLWRA